MNNNNMTTLTPIFDDNNMTTLTTIFDEDETVLACLYGEPFGQKKTENYKSQLISFLKKFKIGGIRTTEEKYADDMSCLAAQLVAHFKTKPGGFYLSPIDSYADCYYDVHYSDSQKSLYIEIRNKDVDCEKVWISDNQYQEIAEFVYDTPVDDPYWRRIGILRDDGEYIGGLDLNDNNKYKLFRCDKILGGESKIIRTKV
jgi:hypothetical protein